MRAMSAMRVFSILAALVAVATIANGLYTPDWISLDSRPLPGWFDEAKVGIFVHWGVFSVPAFKSERFWHMWRNNDTEVVAFMTANYPAGWRYADFASQFRAEFFDPDRWARLFERAGAKYVVLTAKHHDGFTNWPSSTAFNWNSLETGPGRDLVGALRTAINKTSVRFGLYHSLMDWYHQFYLVDQQNNWTSQFFPGAKSANEQYELIHRYQPDVFWSDGELEASSDYWNSTNFLAWLYNQSPVRDTVVVNDRWGKGTRCKHGDFHNCDGNFDRRKLHEHKWENIVTLDRNSFGYRRNMTLGDVLTIGELLKTLAETISCNGNILINIGPRSDGTIDPVFEERLLQLGKWLEVNGEAIYGSKPWRDQIDKISDEVRYTQNYGAVYGIVTSWPPILKIGSLNSSSFGEHAVVTLLGHNKYLQVERSVEGLTIHFPSLPPKSKPKYFPVLKFSGVEQPSGGDGVVLARSSLPREDRVP